MSVKLSDSNRFVTCFQTSVHKLVAIKKIDTNEVSKYNGHFSKMGALRSHQFVVQSSTLRERNHTNYRGVNIKQVQNLTELVDS